MFRKFRRTALAATLTGGLVAAYSAPAHAVAYAPRTAPAQEVFAHLTQAQRVGQLLVVGTPATGVSSAVAAAITTSHAGSVILTGRSTAGVSATHAVTAALQAKATTAATGGVPLMIGTDQEGGQVQVLQGSGFSRMPTALVQGGYSTTTLKADAKVWGQQLAAAGVNLDLAPVADTVPSAAFAPSNIPIGHYDREYGFTPTVVGSHAAAFAGGMRAAGVMATVKHFPGLGRVTANTDTSSGVTDSTTTSTDPYLGAFSTGVSGGAEVVMMSSAYYSKIDPSHPAVFSPTVVGLVRQGMDFKGVIMTDDVGAAVQLSSWSVGARAVNAITAGVDQILTVDASQAPTMAAAITAQMAASASFRSLVDASVLRVLTLKQRMGLLRPNGAVRATDIDEDGGADFVGRLPTGALSLYRSNDLGGLRTTGHGLGAGWGSMNLILTVGDWDGDGHVDLIARNSTGALILYRGNGRGGILSYRQINAGWGSMTHIIAPGDVDGDGHPDLLATNAAGQLILYRGNGSGGFIDKKVINAGWQTIDLLTAVGDFDHDGGTDLIAHVAGSTTLRLYRMNGTGGFRPTVVLSTSWPSTDILIGAGDVDGDGNKDLLARVAATGHLDLYSGNGVSGFTRTVDLGSFGIDTLMS